MRARIGVFLLAGLLLASSPAAAQDAEALRRELEEMRRQFDVLKGQYQKAMDSMSERLQKLEARPEPPPARPAVAEAAPPTPSSSQPSLMELARPRQPFALFERRGAGQLLFDIGVAGDFVGNLTQFNVQHGKGGTFAGLENRFFPREVELSFFGQIDPYARGEVRIEAGEDPAGNTTVNLAEANLTLMTLPVNTQAKLGKMRNRFGLLNQVHDHDLPQTDRPDALRAFFGDGLVESGGELTWVAPLPFYLEALVGLFNGDNDVAFGGGNLRNPLATGRLRTFFELGEFGALQLGASVASGITQEVHRNTIVGFDAKYKYTPEGWQHPLLTAAGEFLYQMRTVNHTPGETQTLNRFGGYIYGEVQPWKRWALGTRYDWTEYPTAPGHQWAVEPYVGFMPSEFLRFRLAYKHTEGNTAGCCANTDVGSARVKDEYLFQATFILGAHPAHPF